MNPELKVGTKVVSNDLYGEQLDGVIIGVYAAAPGSESGATKYVIDWYLDGFEGVLTTEVLGAYERFEVRGAAGE